MNARITGALTLALLFVPLAVSAQVSSIFLDEWGLGFRFSRTSARLAAMGGVSVAIQDETNEIDMWDYGQNVAGFLYDRDAWTGDFWAATDALDRNRSGVGSSGETIESGFQLSFRNFQRALGVEGTLTTSRDEQLSGIEKRKFEGPRVSIVGNQSIGESFVIGMGLTIINESEKVTSTNPLAVAHDTARRDWSFGAVYYPSDNLELGTSLTLSDNLITGISEGGFHRDKTKWDRPVTAFAGQAVYYGESFQIGAFGSRTRLDGGEFLDVSWSREFFLNPSGVDLNLRVPVLDEELKETALGGRTLVSLGDRIDVGAEVSYADGTYDATVNPTFPTFVESAARDFTETDITVGATLRPLVSLALVGEFLVDNTEVDDIVRDEPQTNKRESSGFRAGFEYFWRPSVAVRGGAEIVTETDEVTSRLIDESVDFDRTRWTGGIGWTPRGGMFQLDAAIGFTDVEASDPAALDDTSDGIAFVLSGRTLFR